MNIENLGLEELSSVERQEVNGGWWIVKAIGGFFGWLMDHSDAVDEGFKSGFNGYGAN